MRKAFWQTPAAPGSVIAMANERMDAIDRNLSTILRGVERLEDRMEDLSLEIDRASDSTVNRVESNWILREGLLWILLVLLAANLSVGVVVATRLGKLRDEVGLRSPAPEGGKRP